MLKMVIGLYLQVDAGDDAGINHPDVVGVVAVPVAEPSQAGHNNQMEEVVLVDPVPARTQLVSKAVLIHGLIPMTKNPVALKTPIIREAETGVPEKLEAAPLGAKVAGVQGAHVVNVLPVGAVAAAAAEVSLVKMPSTTRVTGEMIFHKLMTGIMKNILAHWQTLRYLRHLETVAQARNRGHRPPDQISSNHNPSSLSNLCQQQQHPSPIHPSSSQDPWVPIVREVIQPPPWRPRTAPVSLQRIPNPSICQLSCKNLLPSPRWDHQQHLVHSSISRLLRP